MNLTVVVAALVGLCVGFLLAWLALRARYAAPLAAAQARGDLLTEQVMELRHADEAESMTAQALRPLASALSRVERHVGSLERDRVEHFGELGERLLQVTESTERLRAQTATLAGSLNASTIRGAWGETQLRRVLEHAGMLPRCDFEEQVSTTTPQGNVVRPDVVVRLPGDKRIVIDAKAPLSAFLSAQAEGLETSRREALLGRHASALGAHIDGLATKEYWSAFPDAPDMVVCFVPSDAIMAAALARDPGLLDRAFQRHVVLASPATLLALLRTVAFAWQQDSLTESARELLGLAKELYARLGTLGTHTDRMGASLRRAVEQYNSLVGNLESRVFVTARRMHELGLGEANPPQPTPIEVAPRPLTASELLTGLDDGAARRDEEHLERSVVAAETPRRRGA